MSVLKLAATVGLVGLSLAGCVDDYGSGGGYSGVYTTGVYVGGYDEYYGGYRDRYPYYRRYDRYPDRRWDNRDYNRHDDRRSNRDWQGQRPDRGPSGPRPDRPRDRPSAGDYNSAPYSPSSCGSLDCAGKSVRGSNR